MGPFTGGQLTTIIVAAVLVVGFPFAAFAVTGQNVFVTDAVSGKTAKVDTGGHVLSKVSGTVSAVTRPADYSQWKSYFTTVNNGVCSVIATPSAGHAVVLQSISVDFYDNPSAQTQDDLVLYGNSTQCVNQASEFISAPPGGVGHVSIPWVPGIVSTGGFSINRGAGDFSATIHATGFEIPLSSLTP